MKRISLAILICTLTFFAQPVFSAGRGIEEVVSSSKFELMFPHHVPFYDYRGLIDAGNATEGFCTTGRDETQVRECAAFLANAAHETGDGSYIAERGRNKCPDYCDKTQTGGCALEPGKSYYGRGWLQISWNYNYCSASRFIFDDDGHTLVKDPDLLERDPAVAAQASLWFWMTQAGDGTMSPHDCIARGHGFGCTIRSINGSHECNGKNKDQVASRVERYVRFLEILGGGGVKPIGPNGC